MEKNNQNEVKGVAEMEENNQNEVKGSKEKIFGSPFFIALVCLALFAAFVVNLHKCDSCGKTFFGTAYYSSDAFLSGDTETTLCATCAKKSWAPFDYRNYTK